MTRDISKTLDGIRKCSQLCVWFFMKEGRHCLILFHFVSVSGLFRVDILDHV